VISKRVRDISSFKVMDVLQRAQELEGEGHHVIHLEVGEPDFPTPEVVREAAITAIREGKTRYTHAMGMPQLREEIAGHYWKKYGVRVSPDRVLVTAGTSPAMLMMMLACIEDGEEVILSNPGYACYPNFVEMAGGVPAWVTTRPEKGFLFTADDMKRAVGEKTRAVMINSPSNPTGVVIPPDEMKKIADLDVPCIFSDEIYHGLVYRDRASSILEYTDRAFVVNGFSKRYAMTGWRLGYLIFPEEFRVVMERIHQNFMISANSFVQVAGIEALNRADSEVEEMRKVYDSRRTYMIERIRSMGLKVHLEPTGAFYVLADARHFCGDSLAEAFSILESVHVGVTPGVDFGSGAEGFLRFSYANSMENIREGLDRVEEYLKEKGAC
jgi:aspartate/methionine/tyrosine aminotransferase